MIMGIGPTTNPDQRYFMRPEYETAYDLTVGNTPTFDLAKDKLQIAGVAVTATAAELNALDTMTATAAELNFVAGVTAGTGAASKAMVLDASGDIIHPGFTTTTKNTGTAGTNCTAVEYGDGIMHTTIITMSSVAYTIGDTAALADGALIYTLPAGALMVTSSYFSVGLTLTTGTPTTDTPEFGLGTVIATGVVATLDGTATFEDIHTGVASADVAGTALVSALGPTVNAGAFIIPAASAHTVHFNIADTWANVTDTAATASGTVVLNWVWLHA
jgi:hypothetical protein